MKVKRQSIQQTCQNFKNRKAWEFQETELKKKKHVYMPMCTENENKGKITPAKE
jgi:hypothetical protein